MKAIYQKHLMEYDRELLSLKLLIYKGKKQTVTTTENDRNSNPRTLLYIDYFLL
jgi:hypothetical protein